MNDRELLELAAKAAGIEAHPGNGWQSDLLFRHIARPDGLFTALEWNPLADDGDALRLAVGLEMLVESHYAYVDGQSVGVPRGDRCAAMRRAIVRAAAEIGSGVVSK